MKKFILFVIVGASAFTIGYNANLIYFSEDDRYPEQPINFSHRIHAGDNNIPCQYCHIYADKSTVSGVPNVQRCMGCHKLIKTDAPEIQKLKGYWDRQEPIPWVKVHRLADFVYFSHKRHLKANVPCQRCHGDVASMDRITRQAVFAGIPYLRVSNFKMGWCLDCHTNGAREFIGAPVKNGRDCWTCHK